MRPYRLFSSIVNKGGQSKVLKEAILVSERWPYCLQWSTVMWKKNCRTSSLQQEILQKLHEGHQGIAKTQLRARNSVSSPGVSKQTQRFIQNCNTCCKSFQMHTGPLIPTELPSRPWQKLGSDFFWIQRSNVHTSSWLLFTLCRNFEAFFNYIGQYHCSSEDNYFPVMEFQRH